MSLAQDAAVARGKRDPDRPAILEAQRERSADQRSVGDFVVSGPFDPVQPRDWHAGTDKESLVTRDRVTDATEDCPILKQFADSSELLSQSERRVLHIAILLARPRPRITVI